ncbi:MAG: hypothetical protein U0797_27310 [Gemmataceae bacterium]
MRTVADGGESFYVEADHRDSVPALRREALGGGVGAMPEILSAELVEKAGSADCRG